MLTRLVVRNFKLFDEVEIELAERVVFVGPNNSGKTSALQALALWNVGVLRWIEKGNLTSFRLPGGQNRIHRDDFFAFATKHSIPIRKNTAR